MATFTLDSSVLAGTTLQYEETPIEGRGRSISIDWSQANLDEGVELLGYSIRFAGAETEPKDV